MGLYSALSAPADRCSRHETSTLSPRNMAAGRKRKRTDSYPAPFFAPRARLTRSYYAGPDTHVERSLLSIVAIAGERLLARDYAGAAATLPVLLHRYRRQTSGAWYFPREVAVAGAEILRRTQPAALDRFLAAISRDGGTTVHVSEEAASHNTRDIALLERAMELVALDSPQKALECLMEESAEPHFANSTLIQAYIGMLAVACSTTDPDPTHLLAVASQTLKTAAALDPAAYCFVHYAAAAAVAGGDIDKAIQMQRDFVEKNSDDVFALHGLLASLTHIEDSSQGNRQEKVELARELLVRDPMSQLAAHTLREACSWRWPVQPSVTIVELAEISAGKIEHGGGDTIAWRELLAILEKCSSRERTIFWQNSGRSTWWPLHFFKNTRVNADLAKSPHLAAAKAQVSILFTGNCEYARVVNLTLTRSC